MKKILMIICLAFLIGCAPQVIYRIEGDEQANPEKIEGKKKLVDLSYLHLLITNRSLYWCEVPLGTRRLSEKDYLFGPNTQIVFEAKQRVYVRPTALGEAVIDIYCYRQPDMSDFVGEQRFWIRIDGQNLSHFEGQKYGTIIILQKYGWQKKTLYPIKGWNTLLYQNLWFEEYSKRK